MSLNREICRRQEKRKECLYVILRSPDISQEQMVQPVSNEYVRIFTSF